MLPGVLARYDSDSAGINLNQMPENEQRGHFCPIEWFLDAHI